MRKIRPMIITLALMVSSIMGAQEKARFSFPQTEQGQRVAAYFAAFNSGDEQRMSSFIQEHLSVEAVGKMPLSERLERFHTIKQQAGELDPQKVLSESPGQFRLLARDSSGRLLEITFTFEAAEPRKILSIMINLVEESEVMDLSGPPLTRKEMVGEIAAEIDRRSKEGTFSGVVLLAYQGDVIFHKACGLASVEYGIANRSDTRFNLGSINKIFTQVAIEQLAEKGKLSLDDHIDRFLPEYPNPEAAGKISIRHLLEMTSGIGDFFGPDYVATPKDRIRSLSDYLPLFASKPLLFEPGSKRQYSNGGYIVLGLIIEKVSGMSYYDYTAENIYKPAGMTNSGHPFSDIPETNMASGYTRRWDQGNHEDEPRRNNIHTRPARGSSAGGGYSTAMDLLKFATAIKEGRLLGPSGMARFPGAMAFAGGAPGINAELDINPVPGYTVVVLSNYDPPAASSMAKKIGALLKRLT
ncbi:MAG: serine hydrolase domain-containing protein [Candidatus Aminicenantales bacterium]